MNLLEEIILTLSKIPEEELNNETLHKVKKEITRKYRVNSLPTNIQLQKKYNQLVNQWIIPENKTLKFLLMKRKIRSLSGIVPIQVLTKPWPCPGKCIFCPNEKWMPKSYISSEPWAQRALLNDFDPLKQVYNRLLSLQSTGHNTDKIEMIVLWWSFDAYEYDYKLDFIKKLYDACNTFDEVKNQLDVPEENPKSARFTIDLDKLDIKLSSSLQEAQKINETASNRIIGLTIETRPDLVTENNVRFWRELWVTRLEMWVQSVFDDVLEANKRWHTIQQVKQALHLVRKYWLKISVHMMPGLYMSNPEKDIESFKILFEDPYLQPDELKFYPTSVIPNTELYKLWKEWKYKPITIDEIKKVVKEVKQNYIPPYTRIKRLIRDIPAHEIASGSNVTNLRQLIEKELYSEKDKLKEKYFDRLFKWTDNYKVNIYQLENDDIDNLDKYKISYNDIKDYFENNFVCLCTRCREIRNKTTNIKKLNNNSVILVIREYTSSVGNEYFISFETLDWYLIWFTRLLLPKEFVDWEWLGKDTALIRELHVYGFQEKIWKSWENIQHKWFWTKLMKIAEKISKDAWYKRLSVISWVGVRWFYKKIGYDLEWTYMVKNL
jgi:elongator complex protein 3